MRFIFFRSGQQTTSCAPFRKTAWGREYQFDESLASTASLASDIDGNWLSSIYATSAIIPVFLEWKPYVFFTISNCALAGLMKGNFLWKNYLGWRKALEEEALREPVETKFSLFPSAPMQQASRVHSVSCVVATFFLFSRGKNLDLGALLILSSCVGVATFSMREPLASHLFTHPNSIRSTKADNDVNCVLVCHLALLSVPVGGCVGCCVDRWVISLNLWRVEKKHGDCVVLTSGQKPKKMKIVVFYDVQ